MQDIMQSRRSLRNHTNQTLKNKIAMTMRSGHGVLATGAILMVTKISHQLY